MSEKIITLNSELIHTELKGLVRNSVEETLNSLLDAEAERLVNAERYARDEERQGYRSGHAYFGQEPHSARSFSRIITVK